MDVTEWQNAPSVDGTESASVNGPGCPETGIEREGFCILFGTSLTTLGAFSHRIDTFLRIPIKNVVSLDRRFGVSMPMTSNLTLYLWPFHLRKHLKDPISLISLLSKFWSISM